MAPQNPADVTWGIVRSEPVSITVHYLFVGCELEHSRLLHFEALRKLRNKEALDFDHKRSAGERLAQPGLLQWSPGTDSPVSTDGEGAGRTRKRGQGPVWAPDS